MAVAAPEIAEAAEGGAAGESASEGADKAVAAARAGHGRRLTPEVASELRRRASRKAKAGNGGGNSSDPENSGTKVNGVPAGSLGELINTGKSVARAPGAAAKAVSTRSSRHDLAFRVILAFGAFLVALEIASYLSGRYFTYSLGKGGQKLQGAAQSLELYPGQAAQIALRKQLPAAGAHPVLQV